MFQRIFSWQAMRIGAAAAFCAVTTSSCINASSDSGTTSVTPQGTVPLEKLRAGMPETIFKAARITFAVDTHPSASTGGKTQYISRTYTDKNGQYMAQCRDEKCYELQLLYRPPVEKTDGLAALSQVLPADSPPETGADATIIKSKRDPRAIELRYYGNKYLAIIFYVDKSASKISQINAYALSPELAVRCDVPGLKQITIPDYAKTSDVAESPQSADKMQH